MFFEWPNEAVYKWYRPVISRPSLCNENLNSIHLYSTTHFGEMQHEKTKYNKSKEEVTELRSILLITRIPTGHSPQFPEIVFTHAFSPQKHKEPQNTYKTAPIF